MASAVVIAGSVDNSQRSATGNPSDINISISISETFIVAGTLLFGAAGGTILVLLDALFISFRLLWSRRLRWQQIVFNLSASAFAIWTAAKIAHVEPLFLRSAEPLGPRCSGHARDIHFGLLPSQQLAPRDCHRPRATSQALRNLEQVLPRSADQLRRRRLARRRADLQHADGRPRFRRDHRPAAARVCS